MLRIVLILILFVFSSVSAQTLKAGAKYNEASARIEAFSNIEKKIEKDFYEKYKKDPNRNENIANIKNNNLNMSDRVLCPFYIKNTLASYAIMYEEEPKYAFYYNIFGNLIKFDIIDSKKYPRKILGYSRFGNLISASLEIDENEQFVYDENGKLIAHWLNDEVLNKNNKSPKILKLKRGTR